MAATMQSYTYKPLSSKRHIRITEIQPGTVGSPISITLREVLLPSGRQQQCKEKYQTLSYEWGDSPRNTPLKCDGKMLLITTNLLAALQRLRSPTEVLLLWVDSICINQEDVKERSSQVELMPLIYKSGTRVFMWIGEETERTPLALETMSNLWNLRLLIKQKFEEANPGDDFEELTISSWNVLKKLTGGSVDFDNKDMWDSLDDLFSRTYFERTWIIQEVMLSWNATVVCGTHRFPWPELRDAVLCTRTCPCLPIVLHNQSLSFCQLGALSDLHSGLPASGGNSRLVLPNLLHILRSSRCRDPRDQVYALMGMAAYPFGGIGHSDPVDVKLPPPDYSKPVEVVYQETTEALIKEYGNLKALLNIGAPSNRTYPHMPSWVMDWSPCPEGWWRKFNIQVDNYDPHDSRLHSANMQTYPTPHAARELFPGKISIRDRLLITEGICLGTIAYASMLIVRDGLLTRLTNVSRKLDEMYENTMFTKYVNGEAILEAFVKTLLMNKDTAIAKEYGMDNESDGSWTLMYNSFFGALALKQVSDRAKEEFPEAMFEFVMKDATAELDAGLFLAAAKRLNNNRFFTTQTGLMGLGNFDVKEGDRVVMLKGARAPLVLRERLLDGGNWMIVGDAYVHAAMEVCPEVYTDSLLNSWEEYRIN
jgi:hypothetical protein